MFIIISGSSLEPRKSINYCIFTQIHSLNLVEDSRPRNFRLHGVNAWMLLSRGIETQRFLHVESQDRASVVPLRKRSNENAGPTTELPSIDAEISTSPLRTLRRICGIHSSPSGRNAFCALLDLEHFKLFEETSDHPNTSTAVQMLMKRLDKCRSPGRSDSHILRARPLGKILITPSPRNTQIFSGDSL